MYQKQVYRNTKNNKRTGKNNHAKNGKAVKLHLHHTYKNNADVINGTMADGTRSTIPFAYRLVSLKGKVTPAEFRMMVDVWNSELNYKREDLANPSRILIDCGCKTRRDHNDALCPCKPRKFNPTTHTSACKCGRPATNKKR